MARNRRVIVTLRRAIITQSPRSRYDRSTIIAQFLRNLLRNHCAINANSMRATTEKSRLNHGDINQLLLRNKHHNRCTIAVKSLRDH
jgi:hypothetical protein